MSTCSQCGAPTSPYEARCPFCGNPQSQLFADPDLLEACRKALQDWEAKLNELPPGPGWGLLLLWFGSPLAVLTGAILFLQGPIKGLVGLVGAGLLFLILTPLVAALRQRIRDQQYERIVRREVLALMQDRALQARDLALLAHDDEKLKKSTILKHLELFFPGPKDEEDGDFAAS